jgi:CheY-like chemotaxis protein
MRLPHPLQFALEDEGRAGMALPGVLVADDDELVRDGARLGLGRRGFRVWLARDGCEAIELYREHQAHIDVVLLDVPMPGTDGPRPSTPCARSTLPSGPAS